MLPRKRQTRTDNLLTSLVRQALRKQRQSNSINFVVISPDAELVPATEQVQIAEQSFSAGLL
jgi:hypothetical protein